MSDSPSGRARGPVRRRSRTVRGDTSWISNGSAGFVAYSRSGNTMPAKGRSTASMLLKAIRGESWWRSHVSEPVPAAGSKPARLSAR
jgi:hypothetical protein